MLEHLFGSKTRYKMLKLFFRESDKMFFVRELTRALDTQINAVRRELEVLVNVGILKETAFEEAPGAKAGARKKYYVLDTASLLYPELQALLIKDVMLSEQDFLQAMKEKAGELKLLVISGIFTAERDAPTDLLIVGDIKERVASRLIEIYEKEHGHQIRFTFMTEDEFMERRQMMDRFIFSMFESKHVKVVNTLGV